MIQKCFYSLLIITVAYKDTLYNLVMLTNMRETGTWPNLLLGISFLGNIFYIILVAIKVCHLVFYHFVRRKLSKSNL